MSETIKTVSIVIINYNTPELTGQLIDSIRRHTAGIRYDISVVDNGSEPGRRFRSDSLDPAMDIIASEINLGFAKAANLAARKSQAAYLLFANSDCLVRDNILPAMVAYLNAVTNCAACSPRLVFPDGKVHSSIRQFPDYRNLRHSRGSILKTDSDYTLPADTSRKSVEAMAATFMMVRRSAFEQVGGFDERFFMYVEDTDLCKRFHDAGQQVVYLGDLSVVHRWGASTQLHPWKMKLEHHLSMRRYFYKHYPGNRIANLLMTGQLALNYLFVAVKMVLFRGAR
jgi:GT2 family glycosyltransferase